MKELKMYRCEICGNLVYMLEDSGVVPNCCGKAMKLIIADIEDAAVEKHVPVLHADGVHVRIDVGEHPHPMTEQHLICYIFLLTDQSVYMRMLDPDDVPAAEFALNPDETVISAYAWCNLHGLWKRKMLSRNPSP